MNKLKIAPLSAPSITPNPTARPASAELSHGLPRREFKAAKARNAEASVNDRLPSPQQVLEKKFMFKAAANAATVQRPGPNRRVRKNSQAHPPSTQSVSGG